MKHKIKALAAAALIIAVMAALSGCGDGKDMRLPPLPSITPSVTPVPTAKPTVTPASTAAPEPSATPQSAAPKASPSPSPAAATPTAKPAQSGAQTPDLSIEGETLPEDMAEYNVATLHGVISTDCGYITEVWGALLSFDGAVVQETVYYPDKAEFSLAGTVNADLHFAQLAPDTYIYQVSASAENEGSRATETLINHVFTVSSSAAKSSGSSTLRGNFAARRTEDSSREGLIWNYFIDQLANPFAAAAILGNISTESGCDPCRVEGDLSADFAFSASYTAQVDKGDISRDGFIKYIPFDKGRHGYGLCQWNGERKGALYDLATERGASVGDLTVQCDFIMQELSNDYPELLDYLKTADDTVEAACEFSNVYEQAAVHGGRTTLAEECLVKYAS